MLEVRSIILPALFGAFVAACGSSVPTPPAAPAAPPAAPAASAAPAAPAAWRDEMTKQEKVAFMKTKVAPEMRTVFQGHDRARYAEFGCKTCHGPEGKAPKDFLPKLAMKDGKLTAFAEKPEVAKFMAEQVAPRMAAALGQPPFDPATHKGFGCGGCHRIEMN